MAGITLTAAVLGGCGSTPDTGIRLEIDAALMRDHAIQSIHVRTYDFTDPTRTIDEHEFPVAIDRMTLPFSMSIVPRDPAHPNMHLGIEVLGTLASGPPVVAHVETAFIPRRIFVLPVVLRDSCPPCMRDATGGETTCGPMGTCVSANVDPNTLPIYGVDAAPDVPIDVGMDTPDVVDAADSGPPPTDAMDVVDATDVVDVPMAMDVLDAPDVIDVPDVPDVPVVDVPMDVGFGISCGSGFCPNTMGPPWMCGPPSLPPAMRNSCCQPYGGVSSCTGITCPAGFGCMIDPMGNAACCGAAIVP